MSYSSVVSPSDVVGIVPAAGEGRRLGPLPCSKEVYPLAVETAEGEREGRVKVASEYLLDGMRAAGVETAFVILREGKWDIPAYWGDGHRVGLHLAYLMMGLPHGTPFSLDQAYPFVRDKIVVMGFPDVLFEPEDAYVQMLNQLRDTEADLVLGLFPASRPEKVDMVELDADGRPARIVIKPATTPLTYTWVCAVWTPVFTQYLHEHLQAALASGDPGAREMYVGHVIQAALHDGLSVDAVCFPDGNCADIGTPDELAAIVRHQRQRAAPVRSDTAG